MKVTVSCACGSSIDLLPITRGNHAYVSSMFMDSETFRVSDVIIDHTVSPNLSNSFIEKLSVEEEVEQIIEILENEIGDNVEVEKELKELRFDCQHCGRYIVLTGF